jgi:hypothetical protein
MRPSYLMRTIGNVRKISFRVPKGILGPDFAMRGKCGMKRNVTKEFHTVLKKIGRWSNISFWNFGRNERVSAFSL